MFKNLRRFLSILIVVTLVAQLFMFNEVFAAKDDTPQSPPSNLTLNDAVQDPIGYNEQDGYYIDIKWEVTFPGNATARYCNIYIQEIDKTSKARTAAVRDISCAPGSPSYSYRLKNLRPGTIYYIDVTAYHSHLDNNGNTYNSDESAASNRLKVMTDIDLDAYSYGTNQIKIEWDDVWEVGKRIGYKLYVSEDSSFNNTPPIYINPSMIGENGPIKYNPTSDRLEYIHNVRDAGRVYYVKIVPEITDTEIKHNPESETVMASSYILVKTTRMSQTDSGVIWRLDWSPVVTGLSSSDINVTYHIYRGSSRDNSVPQYVAGTDATNYFITVPLEGEDNYYIIMAIVTRKYTGEDVYPGIKIQSDKVYIKEQEIPAQPPAPEIVDQFEKVNGDIIISYYQQLKPNEATILWRVPKKGDGQVDEDTLYDIWLIKDPNNIDNPPLADKIASSVKMESDNMVYDGNTLIGYKYTIKNLTPNTTYYFKIVAKKQYVDYVDGYIQNVELSSTPSMKVVITPSDSSIEQPLIPGRPPLKVKVLPGGKLAVTTNTATIQIKNKWYEKYVNGKWTYVNTTKTNENDIPEYDPVQNPPDDITYRKVEYNENVTINVGCVEYVPGIDYDYLVNNTPEDKVINVPVTANDPYEDPTLNAPDQVNPPVYNKHNVDITLTDLEPNKTYVIWVRAARNDLGLVSGPSDPIIVTTLPEVTTPLVKPPVPVFSFGRAGDTYVDLVWDFDPRYNYYLKYSTTDDVDSAGQEILIEPSELLLKSYYRVEGLKQDTTYYFWIQAEAINDGVNKIKSEWSDSLAVKTLPLQPPVTPKGFGIKNSKDAITKNSITYQWIQEKDLEYIIEIADNIAYTNSQEFKVGKVSEYTVEGLLSNHRYYARLYAYDPAKDLRSIPTQSISVKTSTSNDEYDSDQDRDNVITGDFIEIDKDIINYTWNIRITGVNADRFIEYIQTDREINYVLDLSAPPSRVDKIVITISAKVFNALDMLKENLTIRTAENTLIIRYNMFSDRLEEEIARKYGNFDYRFIIEYPVKINTSNIKGITLKKDVTGINIEAVSGNNSMPVQQLGNPLKVEVPYDVNLYKEGNTTAVIYNAAYARWDKLKTIGRLSGNKNSMNLIYETLKTGNFSIAEKSNYFFDDIQGNKYEYSINNVASLYELKSVNGRFFEPDKIATVGDAVKFMLDVLQYDYSNNYMTVAAKAKIIEAADIYSANEACTREKAIAMVVGVYGKKSGQSRLAPTSQNINIFSDMNEISDVYKDKVLFAIENGMVTRRGGEMLGPKDQITRGEIMELLERALALNGEIE